MFIQLDNDDQKFVVAYVSWSNNKIKAKDTSYMKGNALQLFGFIIPMLSLWQSIHHGYGSLTFQVFHGIKSTHKQNDQMGNYLKQEYDFDIVHWVGRVNHVVDKLIQNLSSNKEDTTRAQ